MPNLVRKSSHGNEVSVAIYPADGYVRKIASSVKGRMYLENEINGLAWYNAAASPNERFIANYNFSSINSFTSIDISLHKGSTCSYRAPISESRKYIERAISHYEKIWPKEQLTPIHGDLTLSNIIYTNDQLRFIDWEHFSGNGYDWGFDIAYLVLAGIYLPSPCNFNISELDGNVFGELWMILKEIGISENLLSRPFSYFQRVAKSDAHLKKILEDSPNKLFPMTATREYIDFFETKFIPRCCT